MKFRGPIPFMPAYTVFYTVLRPMVHMPWHVAILVCPFVAGNAYLMVYALVVLSKVARQLKESPGPEPTTEVITHGSSPVFGKERPATGHCESRKGQQTGFYARQDTARPPSPQEL